MMVAYSFQKQFAAPIIAGTKRQTLRNDRKRHARIGETLQLYTGMRTTACRLVGTATCLDVAAIRLVFNGGWIEYPSTGTLITGLSELTEFCQADGFAHWNDMAAFWRKHHPEIDDAWEGVRILWGETFKAAETPA